MKGSRDEFSKRFRANLNTGDLPNGEKYDSYWLVYAKEFDREYYLFVVRFIKDWLVMPN